ncbi:unnamed protein product [Discosporangium mesarthrocarpum]
MIDMQRDFLEKDGFGESLGNDISKLRGAIKPCQEILQQCRRAGMLILHTREGHRPDMSDLPRRKYLQGPEGKRIGDKGRLGRILIRGEKGHDIIPELYPLPKEPVIDKPGKGSFYATDLHTILAVRGIDTLLVCGVTTEVCVHTTVREANDRGYHCIVVEDACASYCPNLHAAAVKMVTAQGGIFGSVTTVAEAVKAISNG